MPRVSSRLTSPTASSWRKSIQADLDDDLPVYTIRRGRYDDREPLPYVREKSYRGYRPRSPQGRPRVDENSCCGQQCFSTSASESDAGCCEGGIHTKDSYPFNSEKMRYVLRGTGRRRCCAIIWGLVFGALLLGLLIGLLAGLMPAVQSQNNKSAVAQTYPNGYWINGVYYYPVSNPADQFYFAMGPGIPCNPKNNNVMPVNTVGYKTTIVAPGKTATMTVTGAFQSTIPNCNSVTSSYILANGKTVSTTTLSIQSFISSSDRTSHVATVSLVSGVLAYLTLIRC